MKIRKLLPLLLLFLASCAELTQLAQQSLGENATLTQSDIVAGLKEALVRGANNSAEILGKTDGYYSDELVKILLPPEADVIVNNVRKIPGGEDLVEDVLLQINRAAEDAAKEAAPIFVSSIKSMSISDAVTILKGENNAATEYLRATTYDQLFELYRPWDTLTGKWNTLANGVAGQIAGLKPVDTELEDYLTTKALDGLFLKIADEEQQIRENPAARVSSLLQRVFGSVDS